MRTTSVRDDLVVGEVLRAQAEQRAEDLFIRCGETVYTFAELDRRADAVAAGFASLGVRKGDRVAILSPNRIEMVEMYFGLARLGAIQIPLNVFLKGEFLRYQIADCESVVAVVDAEGKEALKPLLADLPALKSVVSLDQTGDGMLTGVTESLFSTVCATGGSAPRVEMSPDDTMSIVYTSGTTGNPKGCVLSHGYYARAARLVADCLELQASDSIYTSLPLFHAGARMLVLGPAIRCGLPLTVDPVFSASNIISRCSEVGATVIFGLGAMGAAMLAQPERPQDRDHQVHTMVMVPMTPENQKLFTTRYGIEPWTEMFGQTECVPIFATPRSGSRDLSSCGRPTPDLEVALLDDNNEPVPPGAVGEICVRPRGPYAMFDGYWRKPEATLQQLGALWYHTGDNGRMLPSGAFVFVDRKKDSLRRRGENVSSMELENAIACHQKIAEVAVHSVSSALSEDDIKACIVLRSGESTDPSELFTFFKENLPYYAIPRYVEIVDGLPRNAVGRIMKYQLREKPISDAVWDLDKLGLVVGRQERRSTTSHA